MNSDMLFAPDRSVSSQLAALLGILMLPRLAFAAGATGPVGLQGLVELLLQITIYPVIGVALAFVLFKATNRAWTFLLIPVFYWGLSTLAPIIPPLESVPGDPPYLYISAIAWLYLPVILATLIGYGIYGRTKRVWVFILVPVLGWFLQIVSFVFVLSFMN